MKVSHINDAERETSFTGNERFGDLQKHESLTKLLIPVDLSPNSIHAFKTALTYARQLGAELHIVHVFHAPYADEHMPARMMEDSMNASRIRAERLLREFCREHCGDYSKEVVVSQHVIQGFAAESIREFAEREQMDMIIMGTRGADTLQDKIFGTVTWNIIRNTRIPVLAIPHNSNNPDIRNIMIPFECRLDDIPTIAYLLAFAEKIGAEVHAVHFMVDHHTGKQVTSKIQQHFRKKIERGQLQLYFLSDKNITEGIRRFATKHQMDMICMATHDHGLLSTLFHMSITRNIALYSEIPLLAYNSDRK